MENFITTLVFLLPGFMMYFWLQSFGINPVNKHSSIELTAISTLLWLPVSTSTLLIYNIIIHLSKVIIKYPTVWSLKDLQQMSTSIIFLISFLILSVFTSFLLSIIYIKWIYPVQSKIINSIRTRRGIAPFSNSSSVWDEVFLNNDAQVVEIGRIDNEDTKLIGEIKKVSRTFEPERNLYLENIDFFTKLVVENNISVLNIFYDTKSGTYIKIFNSEAITKAMANQQSETISS